MDDELLTTGEAAAMLGRSRQGVVDLCERGELPSIRIGTHRRLHRSAVLTFLQRPLSREQQRSLWLHRAVCGRLAVDAEGVLAKARSNLEVMRAAHRSTSAEPWITAWEDVLGSPLDVVAETIVSTAARSVELRQNSPFAGVLTEADRAAALDTFRAHWRATHAA